MVDTLKTSEEPQKETPPGTGKEGEPKTPQPPKGITEEEMKELEELREIKKTTGFKKFSESAKEAYRLNTRVLELEQKLIESGATLSEEELRKEDPDYDLKTEEERKELRLKIGRERTLLAKEAKIKMREDYDSLPGNMRKKIEEIGGYEVFRDFACSPENAGQKSILNVAKAFLFKEEEEAEEVPSEVETRPGLEPEETTQPKPPAPKEGEMTAEQAAKLRTENPKKYNELLKEKKLKIIAG